MGGGGGSTKSVTQNFSPEEAARRTQIMDEALRIYGLQKNATGQYPGAKPVGFSPETLQAQDWLKQSAAQNQQTVGQLGNAVKFGLTDVMDVRSNPYLQSAMQAAIRPVTQTFTQDVLPGISSAAISQGAYGGSRQGVAEALASDRYMQNVSDTAAKMASEGYGQGLDVFSRTMAFVPQSMQAAQFPAQQLSAVGAQIESLAQERENYLADQRQWKLNAPWIPLNNAADIVYGGGSSMTQSSGSNNPARQPLMGAVGGGMAGYAVGAQMGSSFGPYGAAIGAVLGALLM